MDDELLKIEITKIEELLDLKRLNIVLLDTTKTMLTWIFDYCEKNNIPIWKEKSLITLITMTQKTLREISQWSTESQSLSLFDSSDGSYHDDESDDKLPVPAFGVLKRGGEVLTVFDCLDFLLA